MSSENSLIGFYAWKGKVKEAQGKGVCVNCGEDWRISARSVLDVGEYQISGLCGKCWDELFGGEDEGLDEGEGANHD